MLKTTDLGRKHIGERGTAAILSLLALILTLALIILEGCSPQSMAQSATSTVAAQSTQLANPSPSSSITSTVAATPVEATASITATAEVTATGVVTPEDTAGPAPTPVGTPPDPISQLNILRFFSRSDTLVARDLVSLDGAGTDEVIYLVSSVRQTITSEVDSAIGVLGYNSTNRAWTPIWASRSISGTASPLPAANRKEAGGYNGGDILRSGSPVLVLRTTTLDGKAHLRLWSWNKDKGEQGELKGVGEPLKMVPAGGGADVEASFEADLDANVADINDDGIYEVILDNLASVQVWKWDGARFVLRGDR
jgi:hypothetical protein